MIGGIADKDLNMIVQFEVSDEKMMTFKNFVRSNKVRYAKHDVQCRKPVSQYIGPDLDQITYDIQLKASLGVDLRTEMNKLIALQRSGVLVAVMIGDSTMGMYRWVIKDLTNTVERFDNKGNMLEIDISIAS